MAQPPFMRSFLRFFSFMRSLSMFAMFALLGLSLVSTARADLSITGGTAAQQEAIQKAAAFLPTYCRTSCCVTVQMLDNQRMNSYLQVRAAAQYVRLVNADSVDGIYQNSSPTITLRVASPADDISANFTHEYGHYVWFNVLSPAQRGEYAKLYETQRSSHHLVTQYAAVSVEEGFAEAFSFYVRQNSVLAQCDASSCCFLQTTLIGKSNTTSK